MCDLVRERMKFSQIRQVPTEVLRGRRPARVDVPRDIHLDPVLVLGPIFRLAQPVHLLEARSFDGAFGHCGTLGQNKLPDIAQSCGGAIATCTRSDRRTVGCERDDAQQFRWQGYCRGMPHDAQEYGSHDGPNRAHPTVRVRRTISRKWPTGASYRR